MVFMRYENVSPRFEKSVKGGSLKVFSRHPVTYHWKGLPTRNIMTLSKGVFDINGQHFV